MFVGVFVGFFRTIWLKLAGIAYSGLYDNILFKFSFSFKSKKLRSFLPGTNVLDPKGTFAPENKTFLYF